VPLQAIKCHAPAVWPINEIPRVKTIKRYRADCSEPQIHHLKAGNMLFTHRKQKPLQLT